MDEIDSLLVPDTSLPHIGGVVMEGNTEPVPVTMPSSNALVVHNSENPFDASVQSLVTDIMSNSNANSLGELTDDQFERLIGGLERKWKPPIQDVTTALARVRENFQIKVANPTLQQIQDAYHQQLFELHQIYLAFQRQDKFGDAENRNEDQIQMFSRFSGIFEIVASVRDRYLDDYRIVNIIQDTGTVNLPAEFQQFRFNMMDFDNLSSNQSFYLYLLSQASRRGFRKRHDYVYRPIVTEQGMLTHAWERVCTIEEFIRQASRKEYNWKQWCNMTQGRDTLRQAANYLRDCVDPEFETVKIDRHVFAFKNGLYVAADIKDSECDHKFYPYDPQHPHYESIPGYLTACKYFDRNIDDSIFFDRELYPSFMCIPTPHFDKVFESQCLDSNVYAWVLVLVGRLIYGVGERDNWQIIPFLLGKAGTGKSTLAKIVRHFYPAEEVATVSSNPEDRFGLQPLLNKFLWICYEVKHNFGMSQADFQSIISGDEVAVAIKFKAALTLTWDVPGLLCGNEVANWIDASRSIARRLVIIEFMNFITNPDTKLMEKIIEEIPNLIVKCNMAYIGAVVEFGDGDIWKCLPSYFKETQNRMREQTSPLLSFLRHSDELVFEESSYMPLQLLARLYKSYCIAMSLVSKTTRLKMTPDHYEDIFNDFGLKVLTDSRPWGGNEEVESKEWVVGVGCKHPPTDRS